MARRHSNIQGEIDHKQTASTSTRVPVGNLGLQWCYAHYATEWELVKDEWLPVLNRIHFLKGLNGQADDGDPRAHKLFITQKGGNVIEVGDPRLGKYRNYRKKWPAFNRVTNGIGTYYSSIFERPQIVGQHAKWKVNRTAYDAFRRLLITNSVIMEIEPVAIELKIDRLNGTISNFKGLPATQQRIESIAKMEEELIQMSASLDKLRVDIGEEDSDFEDDFQFDDVVDAPDDMAAGPTPIASEARLRPGTTPKPPPRKRKPRAKAKPRATKAKPSEATS